MNSLKRIDLLKDWLSKKLEIDFSISTASSDASFRKYFRVKTIEDSFIVMDAPPQNESIEAFLKKKTQTKKSIFFLFLNSNYTKPDIVILTILFLNKPKSLFLNKPKSLFLKLIYKSVSCGL